VNNESQVKQSLSLGSPTVARAKEELQGVAGWIAADSEADVHSKMYAIGHEQANLSFIERVSRSGGFHVCCACINLTNAIVIGVETNGKAIHAMEDRGLAADDEHSHVLVQILDLGFLFWFIAELLLHVAVLRREFIFGTDWRWNLFDTVLVIMGISEQVFHGWDLTFFRILRLFRLLRVLRFVRACRPLRLMIISIVGSVQHLFWALSLLTLISFLFSMVILQLITAFVEDHPELANREAEPLPLATMLGMQNDGSSLREILNTHYGNIGRSILSLYLGTTGGADWGELAGPLAHVSGFLPALFGLYVAFLVIGVLNIVTGLFVQAANKAAEEDHYTAVQVQLEDQDSSMDALRKVFLAFDVDKSGFLSAEEFSLHIKDKNVMAYFACLDIDIPDASGFFSLLDSDQSGFVNVEEFLTGCLRLKGKHSMDMANIMCANKKTMHAINAYTKKHEDFNNWTVYAVTEIRETLHMLCRTKLAASDSEAAVFRV